MTATLHEYATADDIAAAIKNLGKEPQTQSAGVLSPAERTELAQCEAIIQQGLRTFIEVGTSLAYIRDRHLYRETNDTFAQYVEQRWGLTKQKANKTIRAAKVSDFMTEAGAPTPPSERFALVASSIMTKAGSAATASIVTEAVRRGGSINALVDVASENGINVGGHKVIHFSSRTNPISLTSKYVLTRRSGPRMTPGELDALVLGINTVTPEGYTLTITRN